LPAHYKSGPVRSVSRHVAPVAGSRITRRRGRSEDGEAAANVRVSRPPRSPASDQLCGGSPEGSGRLSPPVGAAGDVLVAGRTRQGSHTARRHGAEGPEGPSALARPRLLRGAEVHLHEPAGRDAGE